MEELPCERLFGCPRALSPLDLEPATEEIPEELKTQIDSKILRAE